MERFTYDPAKLSKEQIVAIEEAKAIHGETLKHLQEDEDLRMQHYYDCVDEYSWGGPCTRANEQARCKADKVLADRIEEIVRGGYLIRVRRVNILRDINTNEVVADGTHDGSFGRYFKTYDGRFVSCAKRISTYEKKGFRPFVQTVTEKVARDGYWRNGDPRYKFISYVSITEEVSTEIVY